jgi:hypothetical protein
MKLKDWYDFVPACVCTFGVLSISRALGLQGAQRAFDAGRPSGSNLNLTLGLEL